MDLPQSQCRARTPGGRQDRAGTAAQELFATQGYGCTTVAQIAEVAQVAPNTVYTSVGGKPQLLAAITEGGAGDPGVAETLAAVARATEPAEVIRLIAAGTRRVNQRHVKVVAVLLDSAQADPAAPRCSGSPCAGTATPPQPVGPVALRRGTA